MYLICAVEFDDDSDAEWLKNKCWPAFEEEVLQAQDENRLDSEKIDCWYELVSRRSEIEGMT